MAQLYRVGNPIDREERANLNLTLDDIQRRFSLLQSQVDFLAGGTNIENLIQEINQAISDVEQAKVDAEEAISLIDGKIIELEEEISKAEDLKGVGQWNSSTNYKKNNIVGYEGNSYLALVDNINTPVTNTSVWMLSSSKGDTGKGLSVKGKLEEPSDLPPASDYDEGDAFYVGQDLYVIISGSWDNVGQIKGDKGDPGDPGSDADVTSSNIINALGYTPLSDAVLSNFKTQYEFRVPTIVGRQIRILKPDSSNRIPISLTSEITTGTTINVSINNGTTSYPLRNTDGTNVTSLGVGLYELVNFGNFFTLRSSGISSAQLSELASKIGAPATATDNFDTQLSKLQTAKDSLATNISNKNIVASGTESIQSLADKVSSISTGKKFSTGSVFSSSDRKSFENYNGSSPNYLYYVDVSNVGFLPSRIIIYPTNNIFGSVFKTDYFKTISGNADYVSVNFIGDAQINSASVWGLKGNSQDSFVNSNGFRLPVGSATSYFTWEAYE